MDVIDAACADLARSGIAADEAEAAGVYAVDDASELHETLRNLPALVLPYFNADGAPVLRPDGGEFFRVRYLGEQPQPKGLGKKKDLRYSQPSKSGVRAYFPKTGIDWRALIANTKMPLIITEGEKKSLAATLAGRPTIGLGGVFNWLSQHTLLPELAEVEWKDRNVYICFDSDAVTNANIMSAEARLATELGLKRGANVLRVRIPVGKDKDAKVGLDDLLVRGGVDALDNLLRNALPMRMAEREILRLNEYVAWSEQDGAILELATRIWMQKHNFVKGSAYSVHTITVPKKDGSGVKEISVAETWLTSPLAKRYTGVLFDPAADSEIGRDDGIYLNTWRGYKAEKGDVAPWIELTRHLVHNLPAEHRDLPLKLLAYKAQNPARKVPLALVMIGPQGCGKSMWARAVREAFSPYGAAVSSKALLSEFNPWVESLVAVIDEAQSMHLTKGADVLKGLISEQRTMMRDLYKSPKQVESYTFYILTSNDRRAGAYSHDDRRMFVIDTPPPAEASLYDTAGEWLSKGGAAHLMQYLLDYDLQGWEPPKRAPMTSEKFMAYAESLTPIQRIAEEARTATTDNVRMWLDAAAEWAMTAELSAVTAAQARAVKEGLGKMQVRPFYTPDELAIMFPTVSSKGSGDISRQLRECGVQYLRCADDPKGFMKAGRIHQYLVMCDADKWASPITQNEFNKAMRDFQAYKRG